MRIFPGTFTNSGFKGNKHHLYGVIDVYMYVCMLCMFIFMYVCMQILNGCCLLIYVCMYVIYVIRCHINVK